MKWSVIAFWLAMAFIALCASFVILINTGAMRYLIGLMAPAN